MKAHTQKWWIFQIELWWKTMLEVWFFRFFTSRNLPPYGIYDECKKIQQPSVYEYLDLKYAQLQVKDNCSAIVRSTARREESGDQSLLLTVLLGSLLGVVFVCVAVCCYQTHHPSVPGRNSVRVASNVVVNRHVPSVGIQISNDRVAVIDVLI